jgi:hypothetical protein
MIDDEIKHALRVDPAPEFVARVRTRIANEPQQSPWRWSWIVVSAAAVAASLTIAIVWSRPQETIVPAPDVAQAVRGAAPPSAEAFAPPSVKAFAPPSAGAFALAAASPRRSAKAFALPAAAEPEILLDPAETRALRALIAGVRDGRVDLTPVQTAAAPTAMDLEPVADIVIAPLTIDPIAPLSGAEGARP